ncbi:MFS transporter [Selenomonas dianae]|uniref:Sugar transporter n=1 Tax=Selenomonas dianae TaxID=135079 RepID=A0ABP3CSM3_9FIRM|nr:MFS transporter [Selenomonas dianae]WLD82427.1 MFS transporter [Selenomonas dianae]
MRIPARQYMMLFGITISAFIFNTSEFIPIALLIDISESFSMTEAATGQMITIYAWVVALLSLPLMLLTCRMELKRLLLLMVALFGLGQLVAGLATSYDMLLGARIIVACAHSIFWSIAAPLATRLVTREHRPMALSMIVTGSSVATIVGLPLGRVIGLAAGWRMTFLLLALVAAIAFVYLAVLLPKRSPEAGFTIGELPSLVRQPALACIYIMTALFATGYFTMYSYIEPFLHKVAAFSPGLITVTLMLLGVSGIVASLVFSGMYGKHRFVLLRWCLTLVAIMLFLWQAASISVGTMIVLTMVLGLLATLYNTMFQAEVLATAPRDASTVATAIYSGIFNVGIGSGTYLGGLTAESGHLAHIGYVGAAIAAVAALLCRHVYLKAVRGR